MVCGVPEKLINQVLWFARTHQGQRRRLLELIGDDPNLHGLPVFRARILADLDHLAQVPPGGTAGSVVFAPGKVLGKASSEHHGPLLSPSNGLWT